MSERVNRYKEQISVIKEKADKYQRKADELYKQIDELESKIKEIENREKLKNLDEMNVILNMNGLTLEELKEAIKNKDIIELIKN